MNFWLNPAITVRKDSQQKTRSAIGFLLVADFPTSRKIGRTKSVPRGCRELPSLRLPTVSMIVK